jgi:N-acyl-D-aspartate/D-glutamate deacylase
MQQPFVFTGSDGSDGHPRKYGTYPKKLREYVREKGVLTLEAFVQRSSREVALSLGIPGRGTLAEGQFADLVVFDPGAVRDRATYEAPTELATGMSYVIVNGVVAVDGGRLLEVLPGRGLIRAGATP